MRRPILGIFLSVIAGVILEFKFVPHHLVLLAIVVLSILAINFLFIKLPNKLVCFFIIGFILAYYNSSAAIDDPLIGQKDKISCKAIVCQVSKVQKANEDSDRASRKTISKHNDKNKLKDQYKILCKIQSYKEGEIWIHNLRTLCLTNYYGNISNPEELLGKTISFKSEITTPSTSRNPHTFNYNLYLKSKGILVTSSISSYKITDEKISHLYKIKKYILTTRNSFISNFENKDAASFAEGVLFGDSSNIDTETLQAFRSNGTAHILAVSGLHIGILYSIYLLFQRRFRSKISTYVFLIFLLTYGTATLWTPSVSRAIALVFLKCFADRCSYKFDFTNSVSLIGLFLVVKNPFVIYNASFQLSFLAAFFIGFLMPIISSFDRSSLFFLIGIQCFLSPFMAYIFNTVTPMGVIANIPVVFIVSIYVPIGIISLIIFMATGVLPSTALLLLQSLSNLCIHINKLFYFKNSFSMDVCSPSIILILLFYASIFYLASEDFLISRLRNQEKRIIASLSVILIFCSSLAYVSASPFDKSKLVFVDVGQGDCLHIKFNGKKNFLIDGGGSFNSNIGETVLKPYLLKNKTSSIDKAIATHLHKDHYLGLVQLSQCYPVLSSKIKGKAGECLRLSKDEYIEILWPLRIDSSVTDENFNSMIFKVHIDGITVLVTGDLTSEGEKSLIRKYGRSNALKCDVLKVCHHGSNTSTTKDFIKAVDPKVAVISVGKNKFGHPSQRVIDRLERKGIKVYRTDKDGAVGINRMDGRLEVCTQVSGRHDVI